MVVGRRVDVLGRRADVLSRNATGDVSKRVGTSRAERAAAEPSLSRARRTSSRVRVNSRHPFCHSAVQGLACELVASVVCRADSGTDNMTLTISTPGRRVRVSSLDPASFAPYGQVIQNPATHSGLSSLASTDANRGTARKYVAELESWYHLSRSQRRARSVVNLIVHKPPTLEHGTTTVPVTVMERRPFTPQTFVPMAAEKETRYLVVVAPTLPLSSQRNTRDLHPAYPVNRPRRKRGVRERLLGARPNPFTNDFSPSTTPASPLAHAQTSPARPKGPGAPDLPQMQAFVAWGDQGVTYGPGTWHAPVMPLGDKEIEFVVVQYENGVKVEDCQQLEIQSPDGCGVEVDVSGCSDAIRSKL